MDLGPCQRQIPSRVESTTKCIRLLSENRRTDLRAPSTSPAAAAVLIHYSLLATAEAIFNLGTLGRNDTSATPMSDLFRGGIP